MNAVASSDSTFPEKHTHMPVERPDHYWLGIDGGGTNCRAAVVDDAGKVCGEGRADAANFIRVGLETAIRHVRQSVEQACAQAGIEPSQISAACIGLAGTSHPDHHRQMLTALKEALPIPEIALETDARVALAGATGNLPGIVIIAGTGSIACGINARGRFARAGGWGPTMGDEGSGSYIGRRALEAIVMAYDYRGEPTAMMEPILRHFGVSSPPELPPVIYDAPDRALREIAQLSKIAVKAAQDGDPVAKAILRDAAVELAKAATAVIEQLRMEGDSFQVAYVGGVFEAGELILAPLREEILKVAPNARIEPPIDPPVIGAVRMARSLKS
ncbi:MAG: BadF/BadG/BcrA/BcrD ATPase family protein [Blastocatellia bacterium]|nr:BadF/BadG/BcrA/BcrD ATPase family protein [Blastocatellia bacterium]